MSLSVLTLAEIDLGTELVVPLLGVEGRLAHAVAAVGDPADDSDEDQRDENEDTAHQHKVQPVRIAALTYRSS